MEQVFATGSMLVKEEFHIRVHGLLTQINMIVTNVFLNKYFFSLLISAHEYGDNNCKLQLFFIYFKGIHILFLID